MGPKNPWGIEDDGKTAGMLSYFFVLGWSMAYFTFHQNDKQSLSSFQLRQTLLLYIGYLVFRYGFAFLFSSNPLFSSEYYILTVNLSFIALWAYGLFGAINSQEKPIPFFGQAAQIVFPVI